MAGSPHHAELVNDDGSWKFTNRLANESSPYLLQHAHNPVDWYPWGEEAFELARTTGKPIFLSVGYSTCYWCHVMERQVFENPEIAAVMNEHFINVKVDREERPDVDDIYMMAVQLMTRHGGWPMSVFLTPPGANGEGDPGLKPFWAGTYVPPEPRHGMPGFPQLVEALSEAWRERRDEVLESADRVADAVTQTLSNVDAGGELSPKLVETAANQLVQSYEPTHGGFGGAPKFPQPSNLLFLLAVHRNNPDDQLWQALAYTLERMARGGMYDQVGGGFHRYSVDDKWLVPHFEKMLYDNGQLVETYLVAHQANPDPADPNLYERVVRQTLDYVIREMTDETGAFWSAQDAEVDAMEGGNYLWTPAEVREALTASPELAELALAMYGLSLGTNFRDPHHEAAQPTNVLFLPKRLDELAAEQGESLDQLVAKREQINAAMLEVRDQRKQPGTDDKVLTAWNGMMIQGMAMAGRVLDQPRYTDAARTAADYILANMRSDDGELHRVMRHGEVSVPGFLDDYAFFVAGLLELHATTNDARYLDAARELTQKASDTFDATDPHGGGYFDTRADQADLFVRTRSRYDGAIPTGNSQMVHNLITLHERTGNAAWLERATLDLRSFAGSMQRMGAAMQHMHHALLRLYEAAPDLATATPARNADAPSDTSKPTRRQSVWIDVEPKQVSLADGPATVIVTLHIGDEYHLNSNTPGDDILIPTTLKLAGGQGVTLQVDYPAGQTKTYPFADEPISVYTGAVTLQATLTATAEAAASPPDTPDTPDTSPSSEPRLVLTYQVCTEQSCLQPKDVELPITIAK